MLCYEVLVNGEKIAVAGMADWAVMSVSVSATRDDKDVHHLRFHVGGLSRDDDLGSSYHARWKAPDLANGSEILIRVLDCENPDAPTRRYRSDAQVQECPFTDEEMKLMRYETYLELKSEFENR